MTVRQNEGFINVYSEPGHGTTFRIYLPRSAAPAQRKPLGPGRKNHPLGEGETILLVEDERSVRVTTAIFLEQLGYTVLAADCPQQALEVMSSHQGPLHLLITDVIMPGMSGRELAARISQIKPQVACLYISGYTANVIAHRGILAQDVPFLGKPFTRDALAQAVYRVLHPAGSADA